MEPQNPNDQGPGTGSWPDTAPTASVPLSQPVGGDHTAVYPAGSEAAGARPTIDPAYIAGPDRELHPPTGPPAGPARSAYWVAVLAVLAIGLIGTVAYLVIATDDQSTEAALIAVPSVIGETQATATNRLTDLGFVVSVEFRDSETGEPGTVYAQIPVAGTEHDPNEPVVLFVVVGEETIAVPNVVDRQVDAAQSELLALGFTVTTVEEASDDVDPGRVIRQSIQPGQEANSGSDITLTISSGPASIDVPDLTNQSQANAERIVVDAGLVPRVELVDVQPDSGSVGNVISQIPGPGQLAAPGGEVIIRVGRSSATGSTTPTTTASTTTTTTSTTTLTSQPVGAATPEDLLTAFGQAWDDADWEAMRTIATEPVVATAMESFSEGGSANFDDEDTLSSVLENCTESQSGDGRQCEFVYAPPEGFGLIFDLTYTPTATGLVVTDLVFGGDAG